jgi:biopolymer transport protein TolQ
MLELILGAGFVVKAVLLLLIAMSVASWAVIAFKTRELRSAERHTRAFLEAFHEQPLDMVYEAARRHRASPLASVFRAGYRGLSQLRRTHSGGGGIPREAIDNLTSRLSWTQTDEGFRLERGLALLATTGSSAPFIGLFGTVVGIMNAFRDIGASGSASLAVVAPGIAEALVATAVGLFAAIPAVVGYNYASARLGRLQEQMEAFGPELGESLRREASGGTS